MQQELWIVLAVVLALAVVAFALVKRRSAGRLIEKPVRPAATPAAAPPPMAPAGLKEALARTRGHWWSGLTTLAKRRAADLQASEWEALEEVLLTADVSLTATQSLLESVKVKAAEGGELAALLESEIAVALERADAKPLALAQRPTVISIVGVNGVGKTTTVGKLAQRFSEQGHSVLLGACDTFRAAAIEQLRVWADRAGAQFVCGREGADPGATAFDAVTAGKARSQDIVLLDTAGRLHTKTHLMDELKRVHKVIQKVIPDAPHEIWLVVDGTLGQNSLVQAKQFNEALGLTGIVITKLDGTAKGGAVLSLVNELKLPVRYIGVGEKAADLLDFSPRDFAKSLLAPA